MCEFDGKLIAWLDAELPDDMAGVVGRHIGTCGNCQERVRAYEEASSAFVAHRDAAARARLNSRRSGQPWLAIAGAVAAALAIFLLAPWHLAPYPTPRPLANARGSETPKPRLDREEAVIKPMTARRHRARPRMQAQNAAWVPDVPMISIAIPADALFAPGAIPDGIDFLADLSIAADGSPRGLRLRP
jgi:hypothetical protein